jgi:hypothetical protein
MSSPNWRDELPGRVRAMQIIIAALVMGCVFILAPVLTVLASMRPIGTEYLVTWIALGFAVIALIIRAVAPTIFAAAGRKKILRALREESAEGAGTHTKSFDESEDEAGRHMITILLGKTILGAALIEGITFFLLIAYMLERSPIALAAAVTMIALLALHFPTFGLASNWIEGQLQLLKEEY